MQLNSGSRFLLGAMGVIAFFMILILGLHLFGPAVLKIGLYSQLFGALLGGIVAIVSVNIPIRRGEEVEPWLGRERLAWTLIGAGAIMWGIGECLWRYFLAQGMNPFPSQADIGYSSLPPLIFIGLLLQPSTGSGRTRTMVVLDSLISMGAILAIAWSLLLGSLAQAPGEANLGKILGLYYPVTDIALLSCVVFLILRGRGRVYEVTARRVSLLLIGLGLFIFAASDFTFNIQQNMGTYVDGTWADLGWPLGLMIIGIAAHLRRFLPGTAEYLVEERVRQREEGSPFGPAQLLPYALLGTLFAVLILNVLANDPTQVWNRPVLLFTTVCVVALVVVRQLMTQLENERLSRRQTVSLDRLAAANARVEDQARSIAAHNANLEEGIAHLKAIQAQLANGNLRARARINTGNLVSLAGSFNLMADRLLRFEQIDTYAQKLTRALNDLSQAFEMYRVSGRFTVPVSCSEFPEIRRLLISMGMKQSQPSRDAEQSLTTLNQRQRMPARPGSAPLSNRPAIAPLSSSSQRPGGPAQGSLYGSGQGTLGSLPKPNSSGSLSSFESPDELQSDFPPLPKWGGDD